MPDLAIPPDTTRSRLEPRPPVSSFDPDDASTVDEKVAEFWADWPDGAIDASSIKQIGENTWRVTAYVWKIGESEGRADSTGSAVRSVDLDGHVSGAYPLETAQSVAIGRALRFLGYGARQSDHE